MGKLGKPNFPQDKKENILYQMGMNNFSLWPAHKKSPEGFSRSKKAWERLYHYCQEIDAPNVQCVQDVKDLFDSWKQSLTQKKKRKSTSGAGRGRAYTEADKILDNILRENSYHEKNTVGTML